MIIPSFSTRRKNKEENCPYISQFYKPHIVNKATVSFSNSNKLTGQFTFIQRTRRQYVLSECGIDDFLRHFSPSVTLIVTHGKACCFQGWLTGTCVGVVQAGKAKLSIRCKRVSQCQMGLNLVEKSREREDSIGTESIRNLNP